MTIPKEKRGTQNLGGLRYGHKQTRTKQTHLLIYRFHNTRLIYQRMSWGFPSICPSHHPSSPAEGILWLPLLLLQQSPSLKVLPTAVTVTQRQSSIYYGVCPDGNRAKIHLVTGPILPKEGDEASSANCRFQ